MPIKSCLYYHTKAHVVHLKATKCIKIPHLNHPLSMPHLFHTRKGFPDGQCRSTYSRSPSQVCTRFHFFITFLQLKYYYCGTGNTCPSYFKIRKEYWFKSEMWNPPPCPKHLQEISRLNFCLFVSSRLHTFSFNFPHCRGAHEIYTLLWNIFSSEMSENAFQDKGFPHSNSNTRLMGEEPSLLPPTLVTTSQSHPLNHYCPLSGSRGIGFSSLPFAHSPGP